MERRRYVLCLCNIFIMIMIIIIIIIIVVGENTVYMVSVCKPKH